MADKEPLKRLVDKIHRENNEAAAKSLEEYFRRIVIDTAPQPKRFIDVAEGWQLERNAVLTPLIEHVAGVRPNYIGPMNVYMGYAKGHDKTSTVARYLNWLAAYPKKTLRIVCAAKDREQSEILRDVMEKEANLSNNKWFRDHIDFTSRMVRGKKNGTKIEFLTSDASGSHGRTPDIISLDEITNWESSELFTALFSAAPKRGGYAATIVLTNAGLLGSWQQEIRDTAKAEHGRSWHFFEQKVGEQLASWMTPEAIALSSKFISPTESRRLFANEWIDPSETGQKLFSPSDVDRCCGKPLPPPPGATVVFSLDYGGTRDRTALTVLWYDTTTQTAHVISQTVWQGSPENEVRIRDLESWLSLQFGMYPNAVAVVDTLGQLLGTAQDFEDSGHRIVRFDYRGGKQNALMLQTLRSMLTNQRIVFSSDCGMLGGGTLASELKEVVGRQLTYGERIDHKTSKHDDRCVSLGMGLLAALEHSVPGPVPQRQQPQSEHDLYRQHLPRQTHPYDRPFAANRGLFGLQSPR